jgi:hypothetical protein
MRGVETRLIRENGILGPSGRIAKTIALALPQGTILRYVWFFANSLAPARAQRRAVPGAWFLATPLSRHLPGL